MTWRDLVLKYFPNISDDEIKFILWEKTCYPFGDIEIVEKQIKQYKEEQYEVSIY